MMAESVFCGLNKTIIGGFKNTLLLNVCGCIDEGRADTQTGHVMHETPSTLVMFLQIKKIAILIMIPTSTGTLCMAVSHEIDAMTSPDDYDLL